MADFLEHSILPWIGKTGKLLHAFISDRFKENNIDITLEQFVVLRKLNIKDGISQREISIATKRHKATMTKVLDSLERKYLIARSPDPEDRRSNRIYLTPSGIKAFKDAVPIIEGAVSEIQSSLKEEEIESLIRVIKKVQNQLTNLHK